jgi:monofunctional biosynthetic peptidoglycan transglycosylase
MTAAAAQRTRRRGSAALRLLLLVAILAIAIPLAVILAYRFVDPPASALMAVRSLEGETLKRRWVALDAMSPHLARAVIASEDAKFCRHAGVDWAEIDAAIDKAEEDGGQVRGASTIPMQTAKNLFLWQGRSYVRKAIEIPLAYAMSALWPKRRMLEIYLNVAEWGPGVFGAEAAARHHFKKSARDLTAREAALLAAALPNPHVRRAGRPGPGTRRVASRIESRAKKIGPYVACIGPLPGG